MQELDNTTEKLTKHDPCRLFKKGDKVKYRERDGRKIFRLHDEAIYEVKSNEGDAGTVEIWLWKEVGRYGSYPYNMFELVTSVEELEPYFISEGAGIIELYKKTVDDVVKTWFYDDVKAGVEALAAAKAECARLNAEQRKEQNQ